MAADEAPLTIADIELLTQKVQAELATARNTADARLVHETLINAIEGLLGCVRGLASELVKVEIEGLEPANALHPRE